ncbi:uncharacterized protein N7477_001592 [Penicillium maclennaniae]|uniref:uncharacterized protein n=1 Tax=Penicillium maclennaniae TaxID=1343394 RepID=UPI0025426000|nr:uncharacterized protein N7477_001592 [Penicillium maclennaniae]KAJ5681652.1 hypothetical protein N7477_001592 [Penicillium maclennaniae]
MPTLNSIRTLQPLNTDLNPVSSGPIECDVQNITARFFLNRDLEELIPPRYLRLANQTPNVQRRAWVFRSGNEYARGVDMEWSKVDIRYRGVFQSLVKCPHFTKGLWQDGSQDCRYELLTGRIKAQSQVIYALLSEIGKMIDLKRETCDGDGIFYLTPHLLGTQMEYWTGYREKHKDAPETAGFLSLKFSPDSWTSHTILPTSTVRKKQQDPCNLHVQLSQLTEFKTTKEQPLASALADKFKMMLGQLLQHLRYLPNPGDKLPDQEVFLIGLHGSKLHLMRTYFPGQKISSLWCRRKISSPLPVFSSETVQALRSVSPETPSSLHVEDSVDEEGHVSIPLSSTDAMSPFTPGGSRFYGTENMERVRQQIQASKMKQLDNEPNVRTFRVLASREYDLWDQQDFAAAVQMLVALHFYLLSGFARCGTLQQVFQKHPYVDDTLSPDSGADVDPARDARVYHELHAQEMYFEEKEEELRREGLIAREEADEAHRRRESMRNAQDDRIGRLRDARRDWWDSVWEDECILFPEPRRPRGDEEMIVGNVDT